MNPLIDCIDRFTEFLGRSLAWLTWALVAVAVLVVVLRELFQIGSIALQESLSYLHSALFMLGAGYALKVGAHVRVDIFYQRLSPRGRAAIDLLGSLAFLLPFMAFLFWISWDYVAVSWSLKERSSAAGGLPAVFLLKLLLLALAATLGLQGIAEALRNLAVLQGKRLPAPTEVEDEARL